MDHTDDTGLGYLEGLFLFLGLLWVLGALFFVSMAALGGSRVGTVLPASNATPIADSPAPQ